MELRLLVVLVVVVPMAQAELELNHNNQAILLDQPCAALLKDLKRRGMLEDTLVI